MTMTKVKAASEDIAMPRTIEELWNQGWVAENEDEAVQQAERMYDLFVDRAVRVDRLTMRFGDEYDEVMFERPWPRVRVVGLSTEAGWDGEVLYAEWYVRPTNLRQRLTSIRGEPFSMRTIWADNGHDLATTAPGIGTAEGFGRKDALVYPVAGGDDDGS